MRTLAALLLCGLGLLGISPAQAATYTFRSDNFAWESSSTAIVWDRLCTQYPGDDDQATITFAGGFSFPFGGVSYSSVRVLANGMLQFGADTGFMRNFTNTALPAGNATARAGCTASATARTLMVYWTDLNPSASGSGGVTWEQKGSAPNRYVVVSWNSVYQYGTNTPYSLQVILFENGEFKYQYGNANASGSNATIGVQVSASDYTLYSFNSGYNANGSAIRWYAGSNAPTRSADYRFEETSYSGRLSEVRDSSGNDRHGVSLGSPTTVGTGYVCRGLAIPANTTSASVAVDTFVNPAGTLGDSGGISFWYRSNVAWNGGTAAMIADARTTGSGAFFVMRLGTGAMRFVVSDSASTLLNAQTLNLNTAANTWVHVALAWRLASGSNQSSARIYINGVLSATATGTTNGSLDPRLGSLVFGDNRINSTAQSATLNSANATLDTLRLYNFEIGLAEIGLDMSATYSCTPPVDHYELTLPSASLSCAASTVSVQACSDNSSPCTNPSTAVMGQAATLAASGGATLASTVLSFDANGRASTTLTHPLAPNATAVTVTLSGEATPGVNARQCCPDGVACSAAASCTTSFASAGFLIASSSGGAATTVPTQVAGTSSGNLFLRAVRSNTTTQACEAALSGAQTLNWAYECINPGTCSGSNLMSVNGGSATSIARNNAGSVASFTSVPMSFDANGNAPFSFNFSDAGQARLWVSKTVNAAPLAGSSNAFVTRPAGFTISAVAQTAAPNLANPGASGASGAVFLRAGESFRATVTAVTSSGAATPNFGRESPAEGVLLTHALLQPAGGAAGTLANATLAGTSFSAGVATQSNLSFSEVGIISLTPQIADGNYLGAGAVTSAASGPIGRFTPARFALSAGAVKNRVSQACAPASPFNYLDENLSLSFTLTAQNLAGGTTANYQGAFAKFDPNVASAWNLAGIDGSTVFTVASSRLSLGSASGTWALGVAANLTLTAMPLRAASPDGPFNASLGIAPVDSDGVAMAAFDMASTPAGSNDRALVATTSLRFGRLRLSNAIGAADRPLSLPVRAQSWNGSSFDTETQDSCTRVPVQALSFGNLRQSLTAADTNASPIVISAGVGSLSLAAPTAGRRGTLDLALSLGTGATDASCLQPWTPAVGDAATLGANLASLRGAWCGAAFGNDPSARATFGRGRSADHSVYRRENY